MTHYNSGDIVVVPFPFVDRDIAKPRPVVVLSSTERSVTVMMITTGSSGILDDDICITDLASAGLPVVSYIRTKIFTLDVSLIKKNIGHLSQKDSLFLKKYLKKLFKYWLQD